jgi:arylsulfatase A-like enzyme
LARRLQNAGYDTVAFTSNPHLFEKYGYGVGFDEFNEYRGDVENNSGGGHSLLERTRLAVSSMFGQESWVYDILRPVYYFLLTATDERPYAPADEVYEQFFSWLDGRDSSAKFFSWVHYMDVHYPFYQDDKRLAEIGCEPIPTRKQRRVNRLMNESPEKLTDADIEILNSLYDAETRFADEQLGRLFDGLRDRGLYDNTVVVITSDHGEALGEHDGFGHYSAHYEEIVRVPLVLHIPGTSPEIVDRQVGLVDIAPTILDYLDEPIDTADNVPFSGSSILSLIEDSSNASTNNSGSADVEGLVGDWPGVNDDQFPGEDDPWWPGNCHILGHGAPLGLRTVRWKYIWWERDGDEPMETELFDLYADPKETIDVSDDYPDVVATFDDYLAAHVAHAKATDHDPHTASYDNTDADIEAQLKALGYT